MKLAEVNKFALRQTLRICLRSITSNMNHYELIIIIFSQQTLCTRIWPSSSNGLTWQQAKETRNKLTSTTIQ